MVDSGPTGEFELHREFNPGQQAGAVTLGPLEAVYQELFADALADGVITQEERRELEKAADRLGLEPSRLLQLEKAMIAAYESGHRVRVVERWAEPPATLSPLQWQAQQASASEQVLLARIEQLQARVTQLEVELREARAQVNVEVDVGGLTQPLADEDSEALLRRARRNPTFAAPYHRLFELYGEAGQIDRQHWVAQVLVALGQANRAELELCERRRQRGLPSPRSSVSGHAWLEAISHPEEERLTGAVFALVAPAVLLGRVTTLRRLRQLTEPKREFRQDPEKATLTAVRALSWASSVLGLPLPQLYVDKDRHGDLSLMPGVPPHTLIGRSALSGRNPLQHAFTAGRHLSGYRQEHFIRHLYDAIPDLEDIFLAAVLIGNPGLPLADSVKRRVAPVAQAIEPLLDAAQLDALRALIMRFAAEGGRTNLQRWSNSAEKTACRAGLALCSDLRTALEVLRETDPERDDLREDLLAYAVSNEHHALRAELGIAQASG